VDEAGALVPGDDGDLPLSPVPELSVGDEPGEVLVPANEPGVVPANEPGVVVANELGLEVPGTLVVAPGMLVAAPGTPTLAPGTVELIGALDIAAPSVPAVGTHGRDEIGCAAGFEIGTGGFA